MGINILIDDNFSTFSVSETPGAAEFTYYKAGSFVANDGSVFSGSNGTTIGSVPYTLSTTNGTDHAKFLAYSSKSYDLPTNGELISEVVMSGRVTGVECNPFPVQLVPNPQSDYRLACFGQANINFAHLVTSDLIMTNDVIYALYEILPEYKPSFGGPGPDYASFSSQIPVGCRKDLDENGYVTLSIAYNRSQGIIRYLVNGEERYRTPRVGFYPDPQYITNNFGGPQVAIDLDNINLGFGTFTLLDYTLPSNNCCDRSALIALFDPKLYHNPCDVPCLPQYSNQSLYIYDPSANINNRLFGQGAYMNLKRRVVYTVTC